jgi:CRISPR-associated protein Cas6
MRAVDVSFRICGTTIPADHGYHLFSAVSRVLPTIHSDDEVGLHPISGRLSGARMLALTPRSALTIRLACERVGEVLPLAGKTLRIGGHVLAVGVPNTHALLPKGRLYSRLVVIKGFMEPSQFMDAVRRQLKELSVSGTPALVPLSHASNRGSNAEAPVIRRTIRICGKEIVGFAVMVEGLSAEDSIRLQEKGLGGRRRFGCGIFVPDRRATNA